MPEIEFKSGALPDNRTEEQKKKDFLQKEIVASAAPVNWIEKKDNDWRRFPIFNQGASGSCVAQTLAKCFGVIYWLLNKVYVHFSATHVYQRRVNKPQAGMVGVNAFEIGGKGVTLEQLTPSQNLTDEQMDGTVIEKYKEDVGAIFKIPNFIQPAVKDFEGIASTIQQTGKAIMVWFYFTAKEWGQKFPKLIEDMGEFDQKALRHSVTATDFGMINGKKYIKIEDSAHFGGIAERWISEEFFTKRNIFAGYPMSFVFAETPAPVIPHHVFTKSLEFGQTDNDIVKLQDILKYEGFFPSNGASTGYYGAITAKAVLAWQLKHNVDTPQELNALQGRKVGPKTIAKLNSLYGQ